MHPELGRRRRVLVVDADLAALPERRGDRRGLPVPVGDLRAGAASAVLGGVVAGAADRDVLARKLELGRGRRGGRSNGELLGGAFGGDALELAGLAALPVG